MRSTQRIGIVLAVMIAWAGLGAVADEVGLDGVAPLQPAAADDECATVNTNGQVTVEPENCVHP
jgi:hypothetical protein